MEMETWHGRKIALIGNGGHASVLRDCLQLLGAHIECIVVCEIPSIVTSDKFITDNEFRKVYHPSQIVLVNGIGSVGDPGIRRAIFEDYDQLGFRFATVIHPSAVVSQTAVVEDGVQVMAGAVIQAGAVIGRNVIVNTRSSIDHDCMIGDHTHVSAGAVLAGGVTLEEGVHIGAGAVVIQGLRIGKGTIVGAGAVVTRQLPPHITAVGVPAKEMRHNGSS
jgi:sugar O-acyltransferase (sialic acid O-acetyltransferase NeuD family)